LISTWSVVAETDILVEGTSTLVVLVDLQRELAATKLSSPGFGRIQKAASDTDTAEFRQHGEVVNVQQTASCEGGETDEAHRGSNGSTLGDREQDQSVGLRRQLGNQTFADRFSKRALAAHGLARVGIENVDEPPGVLRVAEIRLGDFDVHALWNRPAAVQGSGRPATARSAAGRRRSSRVEARMLPDQVGAGCARSATAP
jgi:hypothetical protein